MARKNKDATSRLSARYIDDNILLSATHAWTYMRLPLTSYEYLSYSGREGLCDQITNSLAALITNNQETIEAHLRIAHRPFDVAHWADSLNERASKYDTAPAWKRYLSNMASRVSRMGFDDKEVYLGVCLGDRRNVGSSTNNLGASALSEALTPLRDISKALENFAKYDDMVVSDSEIEYWSNKADDIHRTIAQSALHGVPATAEEIAWLISRSLWPNLSEEQTENSNKGASKWGPGEIAALAEGIATNLHKMVEVEQIDLLGNTQKGYAVTLSISRFPDTFHFPDQEPWMHFAAANSFKVDFSTRFEIVPALKVQKDVGKKLALAKDQAEHIAEAGVAVPLKIREQLATATMLEYTIDKDRMPWAYSRHRLIVTGSTPEEAISRANTIREQYRELSIDVVWSTGEQFDLLCEAMPGDKVRSKSYYQRQELSILGAAMPTASSLVGDVEAGNPPWRGPYLGYTRNRVKTPVFFSPHIAMIRNLPPGIAITGAPGGGKALSLDTPLPTPTGWTTMGDIKIGDEVFDEKGLPCRVLSVTDVMENHECYEVVFDDGSSIIADAEHRWLTDTRSSRVSAQRKTKRTLTNKNLAWASEEKLNAMKMYLRDLDPEILVTSDALATMIPSGVSSIAYKTAAKELAKNGLTSTKTKVRGSGQVDLWPARELLEHTILRMSGLRNDQRYRQILPQVRTTKEILETLTLENGNRLNHSIPVAEPLSLDTKTLRLDPYCLGVWLADGTTARGENAAGDSEISEAFESAGYPLSKRKHQTHGNAIGYGVLGGFHKGLREIGVLGQKHIPIEYLRASSSQRMALLQGILDGNGYIGVDGNCELTLTSFPLAKDAQELMHSLGIKTHWSEGRDVLVLLDGSHQDCGPKYIINFTSKDSTFALSRKKARESNTEKRTAPRRRYIKEIRQVASVPVKCITVDSPSHLYLAGREMIPTHNSFLAFTLAYQMAVQGVWTIYIDPKADAKPMGELKGLGTPKVFDLRHGEPGMLDPFSLADADNPADASIQALQTINFLLGGTGISEDREEALFKAVDVVSRNPNPSLSKVVDYLLQSSDTHSRNLGNVLNTYRTLPFAKLCFEPSTGTKMRPEDGLTVITLLGLELPPVGTAVENLTYDNKVAVAVMYLITRFARKLMLGMDKGHPKAICIDEAWAITSTPQGARLIPEIARMGRSHNTALVLVSQNANDLMSQSVTNSLSTKFAFRSTIPSEIDDVMTLFGLEKDQGYQSTVRDLNNGECLMQDADGRVAMIKVDDWDQVLFDTFNTNPETRGKTTGTALEPREI